MLLLVAAQSNRQGADAAFPDLSLCLLGLAPVSSIVMDRYLLKKAVALWNYTFDTLIVAAVAQMLVGGAKSYTRAII